MLYIWSAAWFVASVIHGAHKGRINNSNESGRRWLKRAREIQCDCERIYARRSPSVAARRRGSGKTRDSSERGSTPIKFARTFAELRRAWNRVNERSSTKCKLPLFHSSADCVGLSSNLPCFRNFSWWKAQSGRVNFNLRSGEELQWDEDVSQIRCRRLIVGYAN